MGGGEQVKWYIILGLFCRPGPGHYFGRKTGSRVVICWYYLNVGISKRGLVMATLGLNGVKLGVAQDQQFLGTWKHTENTVIFSWNTHLSVLTQIIGFTLKFFWTASPSTCFNYWSRKNNTIHTLQKSLGQNTRVTPHCRLHMSAQECRYNFKPTLLPEITHFKLIL